LPQHLESGVGRWPHGLDRVPIDDGSLRLENNMFTVGDQARRRPVVHERTYLGKTPPQGRARIIGSVPKKLAKPLARLGSCADNHEISEKSARLL
jgi:hypothetical protein